MTTLRANAKKKDLIQFLEMELSCSGNPNLDLAHLMAATWIRNGTLVYGCRAKGGLFPGMDFKIGN